jgi:hypothetical protein
MIELTNFGVCKTDGKEVELFACVTFPDDDDPDDEYFVPSKIDDDNSTTETVTPAAFPDFGSAMFTVVDESGTDTEYTGAAVLELVELAALGIVMTATVTFTESEVSVTTLLSKPDELLETPEANTFCMRSVTALSAALVACLAIAVAFVLLLLVLVLVWQVKQGSLMRRNVGFEVGCAVG